MPADDWRPRQSRRESWRPDIRGSRGCDGRGVELRQAEQERAGSCGAGQGVEATIRGRARPHHSACAHRVLRHNGDGPDPRRRQIYPTYRAVTDWGTLVAERVLMSADQSTVAVPAPASVMGADLAGDGWTLKLAPGWVVRPGARSGDFVVIRDQR